MMQSERNQEVEQHSFNEVMKQFQRMCECYLRTNGNDCIEECPFMKIAVTNCQTFATSCPSRFEELVMQWAAKHPEPVYETWGEWFLRTCQVPLTKDCRENDWLALMRSHIPADIAQKLGLTPKVVGIS